MNDLNQILLEGRLVRNPIGKRLESGALVCSFTIASNTRHVNKTSGQLIEKTTYMLVEAWQNVAEACANYLHKGDGVRVTGHIKQSKWMEGNIHMERTFIAAEHVEFKQKVKAKDGEIPVETEVSTQVKVEGEEPDEKEQQEIEEEVKNISEEE